MGLLEDLDKKTQRLNSQFLKDLDAKTKRTNAENQPEDGTPENVGKTTRISGTSAMSQIKNPSSLMIGSEKTETGSGIVPVGKLAENARYYTAENGELLKAGVEKAKQDLYTSGGQREYEDALKSAEEKYNKWKSGYYNLERKRATAGLSDEVIGLLDDYNKYEKSLLMVPENERDEYAKSQRLEFGLDKIIRQQKNKNSAAEALRSMGYSDEDIKLMAEYRKVQTNEQEAQAQAEADKRIADEHPVISSAASVLETPLKALGNVEAVRSVLPEKLGGYVSPYRPTDTNSPWFAANRQQSDVRETVTEKIDNPVGQFLYQAGMSALDSALNMAVSGGLAGAAGLSGEAAKKAASMTMSLVMGSQVAADTVISEIEKGNSNEKALALGIVRAAIEGITEKYSVDEILKQPKNTLLGLGRAFLAEGSEEVASNWLNRVVDWIAEGDKSGLRMLVKQYMAQGDDEYTALAKAILGEDVKAFLAGGLAGMGMQGAAYATGVMETGNLGRKLKGGEAVSTITVDGKEIQIPKTDEALRGLIESGLESAEGSDSRKLAEAALKKVQQGKKVSDYDRGRLARANEAAMAFEREKQTTAVNDDPGQHTASEQQVIEEYKAAVDEKLVSFYNEAKKASETRRGAPSYELNPVSGRSAEEIRAITGVDVDGFRTVLDQKQAYHIYTDHGENGRADRTMADANDVGRIQYILDNYDSIEAAGTTGAYMEPNSHGKPRRAKTVKISKKVNGTYFVIEAVPDTQAKAVYIVSAYMMGEGKNAAVGRDAKRNTEATRQSVDAQAPQHHGQTESVEIASAKNTIAQKNTNVKDSTSADAQRAFARKVGDAMEEMDLRNVSPESLGIENGSDKRTMKVFSPEQAEQFELSDAKMIAAAAGYEPVFYSGLLRYADQSRSDWAVVGNQLYIQIDSAKKSAADIAEAAVKQMEQGKGATDNAAISDRGRGERDAGGRTGGTVERLAERRGAQARLAAERANQAADYGGTSARNLGIHYGSEEETLKIIPIGKYDGELKEIARKMDEAGIRQYYFVVGAITATDPKTGKQFSTSASYDALTDTIIIRADSRLYTATQLAMHELYHANVKKQSELREQGRRALLENMTEDELDELIARYQVAYGNVYGMDAEAYAEEILADAYAGINRGNLGADRYQSAVERTVEQAFRRPETETQQTNGPNERDYLNELPVKQKFSMEEPVEQTETLLAIHNLTEEKLLSALDMGGLPMPSIAVVKASEGHSKYGPISLVFGKDTIDPQVDRRNKVYGSDAWTPTHSDARIEYEVDYDVKREFEQNIATLANDVAGGIFSQSSVLDMAGVDDQTSMSVEEIANRLATRYDSVRAAYLGNRGQDIDVVYRTKEFDSFGNDALKSYLNKVGVQEAARLAAKMLTGERLSDAEVETVKDSIMESWTAKNEWRLNKKPELREIRIAKQRDKLSNLRAEDFARNAWDFYEDGGTTTDEVDRMETAENLRRAVDDKAVETWVLDMLRGLTGEPGIYNGSELFDTRGNRKSFKETHWSYTLENIVRAMNNAKTRGQGMWGMSGSGLVATATPAYNSVQEIHADEDRLRTVDGSEYEQMVKNLDDELTRVSADIMHTTKHHASNTFEEEEIIGNVIAMASQGKRTTAAVKQTFRKEGYTISDAQARAVLELIEHASSVPTGYFEAKPQRAVGLNEILAAIIPDDSSEKLRTGLEQADVRMLEYKSGDDIDRLAKVNSVEGVKFSMDEEGIRAEAEAATEQKETEAPTATQKKPKIYKKKEPKIYGSINSLIDSRTVEAAEEARQEADPEKIAEKLSNSRSGFTGSPALQKIGVQVVNSVGKYRNVEQLIANVDAKRTLVKARERFETNIKASTKEKEFARGLANGIYTEADIPADWDKSIVRELSEWYMAERNFGEVYVEKLKGAIQADLSAAAEKIFEGANESKVSSALVLDHRTAQRNMLKIFGDERGKAVNRWLFEPVTQNEAEKIRFINRQFDQVRVFPDSKGKERALTKPERALVQKVIEGRVVEEVIADLEIGDTIRAVANNVRNGEDIGNIGLEFGLNFEEQKLVKEYASWLDIKEQLENSDKTIVNNAVEKYTALFDDYYDAINDFLVAHGYEPIGFIKGYVPHLQPEKNLQLLQKSLAKLGINIDAAPIPASIAGLTADYKPNKRWNPYFLTRNGNQTQYDIVEAFESYVSHMADVLYHTDDIMRIRSAVQYFRKAYSPEELRNTIDWAENLRAMRKDDKMSFLIEHGMADVGSEYTVAELNKRLNEFIDQQYESIKLSGKFNNLVVWLDNYANILAGKQSMADRGSEYSLGRSVLNFGNRVTRIFARANVAGNLSSALNQTAQLPMIVAENGIKNTTAALTDMISGKLRRAGWAEESDFLTGKQGVNFITVTPGEMITSAAFKPLEMMDSMVSTLAVRGAYLKAVKQGMSHEAAMRYADRTSESIMGARTKGSRPLAFEAKNPINAMVHMFQLEALNSWDHLISDLPADFRAIQAEKGKGKAALALAGVLTKMLLFGFLLNRIAEKLYGGTPAQFDLFGLTANFIASGMGLSTNQFLEAMIDKVLMELFGMSLFDTDEETMQLTDGSEFDTKAAFEDLSYNISNDIPFVRSLSALLGLGDDTLPLPDLLTPGKEIVKGVQDKNAAAALEASVKLLGEFAPGGRQLVKTYTGAKTLLQGGKMKGYGEDARLQYPVAGSWDNIAQGLMFGTSGFEESREYYASGRSALTAKQTRVWNALVENGVDRYEAYEAIYATKGKDLEDIDKMKVFSSQTGWSDRLKYEGMRAFVDESTGYKLEIVEEYNIPAAKYVEALEKMQAEAERRNRALPEKKRAKKPAVTQDDARNALKAMSGLTKEQKAVLWQMTNSGWDYRNNPFSKSAGQNAKIGYERLKIPKMELSDLS